MRDINKIILHCTATKDGVHVSVDTIRKWHEARGWADVGYHYVIYIDGTIHRGRDIDKSGAHTKGQNAKSIGIAYVGGLDKNDEAKDTMSMKQEVAFMSLVYSLRRVLGDLRVHGHNEYSNKSCPNFNVQEKFEFLNKILKDSI